MDSKHYVLFTYLVFLCSVSECSNILGIFYYPSRSHHILGLALLKGLAKDGHNITMLSGFPVQEKIENFNHLYLEEVNNMKDEMLQGVGANMSRFALFSMINVMSKIESVVLESKQMNVLMNPDTKFDLIILFYTTGDSLLGFSHLYKAPVIGFMPIGGFSTATDLLGNPSPYSYVPYAVTSFTDNMNFFERTINTVTIVLFKVIATLILKPQQENVLRRVFPEAPNIDVLRENIDVMLINSHISTETPRPYLPNVIQIGGFHVQEPEDLPNEIQNYLDDAKEGVIYFSLGSNVKSSILPKETINIFLKKFEKLEMKILWKFEDDLPNKSSNVKIGKWFPQTGILSKIDGTWLKTFFNVFYFANHPNIRAFIHHGGMGSVTEGLYYGRPMICIPFFGDQFKNCQDVVTYGVGVQLDIKTITESGFSEALDDILINSEYLENVKLRSELYRNQPIKPLDKAIFWVNHVLKYKGAKHLKNKGTSLMWYQYFLLDVIAFLGAAIISCILIIYFFTKWVLRKIFGKKNNKKVKMN